MYKRQLYGCLKAGDVLVSAVGAPYDTMLGVIGVVDKGHGSLKDYGIEYRQVELLDNKPDLEAVSYTHLAVQLACQAMIQEKSRSVK